MPPPPQSRDVTMKIEESEVSSVFDAAALPVDMSDEIQEIPRYEFCPIQDTAGPPSFTRQ